ncbi:MAG: M48 family metalloprotease [Hymenobacteraceae bacterium]|nr:M48 family metalloprotease [Hymenobacteraceae bacterium]MDX5397827.1 M48 family metalloprotease [Hymenobacteraceae bacterium]MDX5443969.1 M48 family metalloprotease [Hymenobacteraceae bacterium]MDX5513904.1 M48 family metalloprotease [Hymenobacteraceae bacterium]
MKQVVLQPFLVLMLFAAAFLSSCSKDKEGNRLIFSIEDDIKLGNEVAAEVDSIHRANGTLLERNDPKYQQAYTILDGIVQEILNSGKVTYRTEFPWEVKIIKEDSTLNAFATPGGHIYVYTGLIKYLDSLDHFAGVLGHEIAHADKRHTSKRLQQQYSIALLLSVILGDNPGTLTNIAVGLAGLNFSREDEREADDFSVVYLSGTRFACNGAAGFFQKLLNAGQAGGPPEFLSTHPSPGNRVQDINAKAAEINCDTSPTTNQDYNALKQSLNL